MPALQVACQKGIFTDWQAVTVATIALPHSLSTIEEALGEATIVLSAPRGRQSRRLAFLPET
jgi:hypothetical protein